MDSPEPTLELVSQPTVEELDRNFIRKTLQYIQTLPGAQKDKLLVQTNTKLPSRYILMISNLPVMAMHDFNTITTLAPRLRAMTISLKDNWLKIDMWKQGAQTRVLKRKITQPSNRTWNLKSITSTDRLMLVTLLDGISNLPSFPCQFHVDITNVPPDNYTIDIISNDVIDISDLVTFKQLSRAFLKDIQFNFSGNSMKMDIEKASATTNISKRRIVVYNTKK